MIRLTLALPAIALLAGCSSSSGAAADVAPWSSAFTVENSYINPVVAAGPQGDVAIAGQFVNGVAFDEGTLPDQGDQNTTLAVLDATGAFRFEFTPHDLGASGAMGVTFDAKGDVVTCGSFQGKLPVPGGHIEALSQDTYLAAFDLAGKNLWTRHFSADLGGPTGAGTSSPSAGVASTPDGGIVMAGSFTGTFGLGGPPLDTDPSQNATFIAKLDAEGRYEWQLGVGGTGNEPTALAVDGAGNVVVAGTNQQQVILDGHTFDGEGSMGPLPFLVSLAPDGKPRWAAQIGGGTANIYGLGVDSAGDVFAAGTFSGRLDVGAARLTSVGIVDAFVLALSSEGKPLWVKQMGDDIMGILAIAVTGGGHAVITGTYVGSPKVGSQRLPFSDSGMFLAELDPHGEAVPHARAWAFPQGSAGTGLALPPGGDILLTGTMVGRTNLGSGTIGNSEFTTNFVARVPPILASK